MVEMGGLVLDYEIVAICRAFPHSLPQHQRLPQHTALLQGSQIRCPARSQGGTRRLIFESPCEDLMGLNREPWKYPLKGTSRSATYVPVLHCEQGR